MGDIITQGGGGTSRSIVDTIDRQNAWRKDIQSMREQYDRAIKSIQLYLENGHSRISNLRYAVADIPAGTRMPSVSTYDVIFQLYILDNLFCDFLKKAVITPYRIDNPLRVAGAQEGYLSMDRLFGIANLASKPNPSHLERHDFFKGSFSGEELQRLEERLNQAYDAFSFAIHPNNTSTPDEWVLSGLDSLAVIGVKISNGQFRDFEVIEGKVSRKYDDERTYEGNPMPAGVIVDGENVRPINVRLEDVFPGSRIKYIMPHLRDPMLHDYKAFDGIILEISAPR